MTTRKATKHAGGRPNEGNTEARLLVMGPAELLDAMRSRARELGVSDREAWRRAARAWLGWTETPERVGDGKHL